jgi:hypothetical protein
MLAYWLGAVSPRVVHIAICDRAWDAMLRSGKHRGSTTEFVEKKDKGYCSWLIEAYREKQPLPPDLKRFGKDLMARHGGVLHVGKHKGEFFDEVATKSPDYAEWSADLPDPGAAIKNFSEYARKRRDENAEDQQPCQKKTRTDDAASEDAPPTGAAAKTCCICLDRAPACAFVPCGHMVSCCVCAESLWDCPVCRSEIAFYMKVYT